MKMRDGQFLEQRNDNCANLSKSICWVKYEKELYTKAQMGGSTLVMD